jgi:hypothetical protein
MLIPPVERQDSPPNVGFENRLQTPCEILPGSQFLEDLRDRSEIGIRILQIHLSFPDRPPFPRARPTGFDALRPIIADSLQVKRKSVFRRFSLSESK